MTHIYRLVFLSIIVLHFLPALSKCPNNITAIYAFGDGFLDTGNNNNPFSICFAKNKPYGVSFPDHFPTGRFSDAEVATDLISAYLGHSPLLPSFSHPGVTAKDMLSGVSFASGCSGMDDYTPLTTKVLSMKEQEAHFEKAFKKMTIEVGTVEASKTINGALFLISGGTHDFLNNFYPLPFRGDFSVSTYIGLLQRNLMVHVRHLHTLGARKIAIMGLPPLGCLPFAITAHGDKERICVQSYNKHAEAYNHKLQDLLRTMQSTLQGLRVAYLDIYTPIMDMALNPKQHGLEVSSRGCCGTGFDEIGTTCSLARGSCNIPSSFLFWDAIHPSRAAFMAINNQIQAKKMLDSLLF